MAKIVEKLMSTKLRMLFLVELAFTGSSAAKDTLLAHMTSMMKTSNMALVTTA